MKRLKEVILITSLFFSLNLWCQKEYLVIFMQDTATSFADKDFTNNYLGEIKEFAEENEIDLILRDVKDGTFKETTFTPSIYFINEINYSLYVGRYKELNRFKNFVRSARSIRRSNKPVVIKNAFVLKKDKMSYSFPVKVTGITGNYKGDKAKLQAKLLKYAQKNFKQLEFKSEENHPVFGRKYYMDFYPYVDGKKLFINSNAFSEFNCKKPIYKQSIEISGNLKEAEKLMSKAKEMMLKAIMEEKLKGTKGDAHTLFSDKMKIITLKDIGIVMEKKEIPLDIPFPNKIPNKWKYKGPVNAKTSIVQFNVPSSIYTGQMKGFDAEIDFNTMEGKSEVDMSSLSMGAEGLDYSVSDRILTEKFPTSSLVFKKVLKAPEEGINGFNDHEYLIRCDFTFVGKTIERDIIITFTPFMDKDELLIHCQAQFDIRLLESFGIDSGVGDNLPDHDTVQFYLNFIMQSQVE